MSVQDIIKVLQFYHAKIPNTFKLKNDLITDNKQHKYEEQNLIDETNNDVSLFLNHIPQLIELFSTNKEILNMANKLVKPTFINCQKKSKV